MDRLRPPTGSILPVAGDGAVQGVRAPRALSRLGSTVRGYWEKLLEHLLSCWHWFLAFVLGVLGDSVKMMGSWIAGVLKWIRLIDENPVGRIDELRARLGILVGTCLAMAAIMGTFVSVRLVNAYMTRKGEVLQEREKGLYRQKRALAQRIQGANDDIRNIENTYLDTIGNILENAKEHRFRYFFRFVFSDYGWDEPACRSLVAARKAEARLLYKKETERIEVAFLKASKRVDKEYNMLLDSLLDVDRQLAAVEV
ncbi:hypothetical protein TrVGV298_000869 [Trichoderma virens]|nr:hypothetical protein TrVGV298_000869 [Trichoderma virens]